MQCLVDEASGEKSSLWALSAIACLRAVTLGLISGLESKETRAVEDEHCLIIICQAKMIGQIGGPNDFDTTYTAQIPPSKKFPKLCVIDSKRLLRNEVLRQGGFERVPFPADRSLPRQADLALPNLSHE